MNDEIDGRILTILQQDARTSNAEIARQLGMAPSAIFERIRKLEARGVITGYETRLNPHALAAGLLAFVFVRDEAAYGTLATGAALAAIPEVQEVHNVAGEDCYLVKVRVADTDALGRLLRERFGAIPSIRSTRTTIVLDTIKESARVNLARAHVDTQDDTQGEQSERDREERYDGER
jgi:Lrp/AsnC family leucine-responsive transcriptional regulator